MRRGSFDDPINLRAPIFTKRRQSPYEYFYEETEKKGEGLTARPVTIRTS
jgi:hypothetical protein